MTHAAFEAWKNLKFDPVKDDVEEFMTTIKNLHLHWLSMRKLK